MISLLVVGAGFLFVPGFIAEPIVYERESRLRNLLTVCGCDFNAYWLGTFIADYGLALVPVVATWLTMWLSQPAIPPETGDYFVAQNAAGRGGNGNREDGEYWKWNPPYHGFFPDGRVFAILPVFALQLVAYAYVLSFLFPNGPLAIAGLPIFFIVLLIVPPMLVLVLTILLGPSGANVRADFKYTFDEIVGLMVWAWVVCSPHMNMFFALLQVNYLEFMRIFMSDFPGVADCVAIAFAQSVVALGGAYALDRIAVRSLEFADTPAPGPLDARVRIERERVLELDPRANAHGAGGNALVMKELRKVYRPKRPGAPHTVACANMCAGVAQGEIFGLLGANGAGKTTAMSMVMRAVDPTAGEAFVAGHTVLQHAEFLAGATSLGVVNQHNTLWDLLTPADHLALFARLRGVPEPEVRTVVDAALDQTELRPHRAKLTKYLSGGMKRKLCLAIALIGDPQIVLLDEPTAGLDPV